VTRDPAAARQRRKSSIPGVVRVGFERQSVLLRITVLRIERSGCLLDKIDCGGGQSTRHWLRLSCAIRSSGRSYWDWHRRAELVSRSRPQSATERRSEVTAIENRFTVRTVGIALAIACASLFATALPPRLRDPPRMRCFARSEPGGSANPDLGPTVTWSRARGRGAMSRPRSRSWARQHPVPRSPLRSLSSRTPRTTFAGPLTTPTTTLDPRAGIPTGTARECSGRATRTPQRRPRPCACARRWTATTRR